MSPILPAIKHSYPFRSSKILSTSLSPVPFLKTQSVKLPPPPPLPPLHTHPLIYPTSLNKYLPRTPIIAIPTPFFSFRTREGVDEQHKFYSFIFQNLIEGSTRGPAAYATPAAFLPLADVPALHALPLPSLMFCPFPRTRWHIVLLCNHLLA